MNITRIHLVGRAIPSMIFLVAVGISAAREPDDDAKPFPPQATDAEAKAKPEPGAARRPILGRDRLGGGSIAGLMSIADLIRNPEVAKELKLTPDRQRAIQEAVSDCTPEMTRLIGNYMNANTWSINGTGTRGQLDDAIAALEKVEAQRTEAVRSRLSRTQYKRLMQIALQRRGIRALTLPEVASAVNFSPEQFQMIKSILADREPERAALIQRALDRIPPADRRRYDQILSKEKAHQPITDEENQFMKRWFERKSERDKLVEKFEDEVDARLWKVLNRVQKNRFLSLLGEPIDIDRPPAGPEARQKADPVGPVGQSR